MKNIRIIAELAVKMERLFIIEDVVKPSLAMVTRIRNIENAIAELVIVAQKAIDDIYAENKGETNE